VVRPQNLSRNRRDFLAVFDEDKHNELMKAGLKVKKEKEKRRRKKLVDCSLSLNVLLFCFSRVSFHFSLCCSKDLSFRATQAALLITLYGDQPQLRVPCELLRRLVSIDGLFAQWRHRHALVVQV